MAWDEGGHRLLAFGGSTIGTWTEAVSHLWQLALEPAAKWSLVPGTSPPVPDPRAWAALALDPVLGRLLMNGGAIGPDRRAQASSTRDRGLWSHPLGADTSGWTAPTPPSPPHTLVGMAAAADTGARVWYVHGGSSWGYNPVTSSTLWRVPFDDPTRWEPIEATSDGNYRSRFHELVDDPTRNELWQFSPLRRLRLDDPIAWETLSPTGTGPTDSYNAAALYDAPRDRILYFAPRPGVLPGIEVWALAPGATPPAWTLVPTTGGAPLLDDGYTANYDPLRDRVIVFGGFYNESGGMSVGNHSTDSTWALDFSVSPAAWSRLPSLGSDRSRAGHTAVIDPKRNLLIVAFGALEQQGGCCINSYTRTDVWALDLRDPGGWIPLVPNTSSPRPRIWGIAAFDAQRDRMLLYGGQSLTEAMILIEEWGYEDAVWELDFDQAVPLAVDLVEAVERDGAVHLSWHSADAGGLSATVERQDLPDDAWRALGAAVVDAGSRDRLVFVDADVVAGRTYAYRMRWFEGGVAHTGPPVEVAVGSGPGSGGGPALALASRNPSPDGWVVHVRVREGVAAAGERLELLDVRGRRVWSRSLAGLPAGVHAIAVPQPDGAGAGIYFARWRRAVPDGGTPTLRLVRLPD